MSRSQRLETILDKAKEKEKRYDWLEAVELYEQVLSMVGKSNFLRKGEIQKRISDCHYRAAFQAETQGEFRTRMSSSVKAYEEAAWQLERLKDSEERANLDFCKAMANYGKFWLTEDSAVRMKLLNQCARARQLSQLERKKAGSPKKRRCEIGCKT